MKVLLKTALLSLSLFGSARAYQLALNQDKVDKVRSVQLSQAQTAFSNPSKPKIPGSAFNFTTSKTKKFLVDGANIPDVDFDVGDSYAGLLPISKSKGETRELFFWFFPSNNKDFSDLTIWLNGGPGCSSMDGLLQENGPFLWQPGVRVPQANPYTWTNLSHVLYIDQPVGVGYTQGKPNITNELELAPQFAGFLENFLETFDIKKNRLFLTGESYAGQYIPYIADYLLNISLPVELTGIWLGDPSTSTDLVQSEIPAVPYVEKWASVFNFNESYLAELKKTADSCGYTNFTETYLTYPPKGPLPYIDENALPQKCDVWDAIYAEALRYNPSFNVYHVLDTPPTLWTVLGFPGLAYGGDVYFNRSDVQKTLHVPPTNWAECVNGVFLGQGDTSAPTGDGILPSVIERLDRSMIVHGLADFLLIAEGTRIMIQNMTWHGQQGFQTPIKEGSFIDPAVGAPFGNSHTERNFTYVEVDLSGHEVPEYQPAAAFKTFQFLLGHIDSV